MSQSTQTILNIANEIVGNVSLEDALALHEEYQSDTSVTICPFCEQKVSVDELTYVMDSCQTYDDPEEGHNECPNCAVELSSCSLDKPSFQLYLELTA